MPILFAFILVGLDNIQEHLENPFDQIGVDDVAINAEKFVDSLEYPTMDNLELDMEELHGKN